MSTVVCFSANLKVRFMQKYIASLYVYASVLVLSYDRKPPTTNTPTSSMSDLARVPRLMPWDRRYTNLEDRITWTEQSYMTHMMARNIDVVTSDQLDWDGCSAIEQHWAHQWWSIGDGCNWNYCQWHHLVPCAFASSRCGDLWEFEAWWYRDVSGLDRLVPSPADAYLDDEERRNSAKDIRWFTDKTQE